MDIKEYYRRMVGDLRNNPTPGRQTEAHGWYENYKKLKKDVRDMRNSLIKDSKKRLSVIDDIKLIRGILYENAVANGGQGRILEECFQDFIKDGNIIVALEALIKEPNVTTAQNLFIALLECNKRSSRRVKNNWLIVNRAIGACTDGVSSTASNADFDLVFDFFVKEGVIAPCNIKPLNSRKPEDKIRYWYERNQHLMKELQEKFQTELGAKETDITLLSIFFWEFNEYKVPGLPPKRGEKEKLDLPDIN